MLAMPDMGMQHWICNAWLLLDPAPTNMERSAEETSGLRARVRLKPSRSQMEHRQTSNIVAGDLTPVDSMSASIA